MNAWIGLRAPRTDEMPALAALCRSKAAWGYDTRVLERCAGVLRVDPERAREGRVAVAERDGAPVGVVQVDPGPGGDVTRSEAELGLLFVEPSAMGAGVGGRLLACAMAAARRTGALALRILADPHARAFYEGKGARRLHDAPSEVDTGRLLPLLSLK